jgi:hypothetical protein
MAAPGERCEMCGTGIPADEQTLLPRARRGNSTSWAHAHVVDLKGRRLLCTCRACALLFPDDGPALAYRMVPDRYLSLPGLEVDWDALQIPVGLAFFFVNSTLARTVGCYPSPAGAVESQLPLEQWADLRATSPALTELNPDVEALLVRSSTAPAGRSDPGTAAGYIVPIDACYALVGRVRQLWRGFDGGAEVRELLRSFFVDLDDVCRPFVGGDR